MNVGILHRSVNRSIYPNFHSVSSAKKPSSGAIHRSSVPQSSCLTIDGHKMAVVNLEAVLTSWKSIENHKVACLSNHYRKALAAESRVNPARVGALPPNLMEFMLSSDRRH